MIVRHEDEGPEVDIICSLRIMASSFGFQPKNISSTLLGNIGLNDTHEKNAFSVATQVNRRQLSVATGLLFCVGSTPTLGTRPAEVTQ